MKSFEISKIILKLGTELVAKLLIENGANVNDRRANGGTPLYMSAYFGRFAF